MIDRKITPILEHRLTQYAAVVLVGPRQAAKTTLARSLGGINQPSKKVALRQRHRLEPRAHCPGHIQKLDVAAADAIALHLLKALAEPLLLVDLVGTGHPGRRHPVTAACLLISPLLLLTPNSSFVRCLLPASPGRLWRGGIASSRDP